MKNTNKKSKLIFNIIFWITIIVLAFIWITDYTRTKDNKEPKFCLSKQTHKFDDGKVTECIGLGYKIYKYDRSTIAKGIEFGPFFMQMRDN